MAVNRRKVEEEDHRLHHGKSEPDAPLTGRQEITRVGVLGGTFDPIHYGHLFIAEEARVRIPLGRVLFVPAAQPPHKPDVYICPAHHRLRMIELAVASNPHFEVSTVDLNRPGPDYSVDMLRLLRKEWGPQAEFYFIMGLDSLAGIMTWHDPAKLIELCTLAVARREGYEVDLTALEASLPGVTDRTLLLDTPELGISSSDLERRVREGLPIKYLVPQGVEDYIRAHGLYLDTKRH